MIRLTHTALLLLVLASPVFAQCQGRCPAPPRQLRVGDVIQLGYQQPAPVRPSPQSVVTQPHGSNPPPVPLAVVSDPYGFGVWLNGMRASIGMRPLHLDANLSAWAAANSARGYAHSVMGTARRQNVGMGSGSSVWPMWADPRDPAHSSALFDPYSTAYGIAFVNGIWTFNAN